MQVLQISGALVINEEKFSYGKKETGIYPGRSFEFALKQNTVTAVILDNARVLFTIAGKEIILSIRDFLVLYDFRRQE